MSLLDPILSSIRARLSRLERAQLSPREGVITQTYPMMVRLDGDTVPTPARPMVSAGEGMRVLCIKVGFRWYALGPVGSGAVVEYINDDIFSTLDSSVGFYSESKVRVQGSLAVMSLALTGVQRSDGNQATSIGSLIPSLYPQAAIPLPAYYSDGSAMIAITSGGNMTVRWASSERSNALFVSGTYLLN